MSDFDEAEIEAKAIEMARSGKYESAYDAFETTYGKVKPSGIEGVRWDIFYTAFTKESRAVTRAMYPVDEFKKELNALCVKYGVTLSSGCGCCDAGGVFSDGKKPRYDFSFSFPMKDEEAI